MTKEEREKAAERFCDDFCRFPREWDEDEEGVTLADGVCAVCPLSRLIEDEIVADAHNPSYKVIKKVMPSGEVKRFVEVDGD